MCVIMCAKAKVKIAIGQMPVLAAGRWEIAM